MTNNPRRSCRFSWLSVFAIASSGCASHVQSVALDTGSAQLDCPTDLSTPWLLEPENYRVRGCGREIVVTCQQTKKGPTCSSKKEPALSPPRTVTPLNEEGPSRFEVQLEKHGPKIVACRPGSSSITLTLKTRRKPRKITRDGKSKIVTRGLVELEDAGKLKPSEVECVKPILDSIRLEKAFPADEFRFAFFAEKADQPKVRPASRQSRKPRTSERPQSAPDADTSSSVDRYLRRELEQEKAAITACAGASMAVVELRYDREKILSIELVNQPAEAPEQGCVRAVLQDLRVPTGSSAPGSLRHVLRN